MRLGGFIGAHMPVVVLSCVAAGVLLPNAFSPFNGVVPFVFAFMTFQGSLSNTFGQLLEVFRRPLPLLAILFTTLVFMPLLAFFLGSVFFGGNPNIVTGLVLGYSIPVGVVSFMWVGMMGGNGSLGLAAILVSTVLSPFTMPLTLQLLLGATIEVDVAGMMFDMIVMIALPALAGMVVNDLTHGWGCRTLSPAAAPLSKLFLMLVITCNATSVSPYVLHMTWERAATACFVLTLTSSGFLWGTLAARLMRLPRAETVTMGYDCGLRNISSGTVIATQYFPGEVVFPVMCGTFFQQMLAAMYGKIFTKLMPGGQARADGE